MTAAFSPSEAEGQRILRLLYEHPDTPIALDTETTSLHIVAQGHAIGVSIAAVVDGEAVSHYFPVNHPVGVNVSQETLDMLLYVLQQPRLLIYANAQYDILAMETLGVRLDDSEMIDIIVMAHLIDENRPFQGKSLEALAQFYLGEQGKVEEFEHILERKAAGEKVSVKGIQKRETLKWQKENGWPDTTPEMIFEYARIDAVTTWRIWNLLRTHPAWLELPEAIPVEKQELTRVLLEMHRRGVDIDTQLTNEYIARGENEMARIRGELGLDPAKRSDQYTLFIERLGLPILKSGKTGPSFDKTVMAEYDDILAEREDDTAKLVKAFRGWQTALGLMYRPYIEQLDPDGALRCSYKMHGTATGRLSCSRPNLQQIPKESVYAWNGRTKEMFIPRPGYTLINADFSQLELRLATAYAGESQLKAVFEAGRDIFTEMSGQLGMERHQTKTLVYSMQYGAGLKRLMSAFHVTKEHANAIRENYFATYPRFKNLSDITSNRVTSTGKIRIWTGRYRRFLHPANDSYKAMNSLIQGGAADIVERVMIRCFREVDNDDCRILLQVHDSLTWEVRTELVEHYIPIIKATMEDVAGTIGSTDFAVRFAVEVDFWSPREAARYSEWKAAA